MKKVSYCDNCGFSLPDGSAYCPHCGVPVKKRTEVAMAPREPIGRILQAGVIGAFLSVMISSLSPPNLDLYFIPSFVSVLITIYLSRSRRLDEALAVALAVYLFAEAILTGLTLGTLYAQDIPLSEVYGEYVPSLVDVVMYTARPITAVVAGYIGVRISPKPSVKERSPLTYRRDEEPGGIIYSLERDSEKPLTSSPHKV